jgi:regulation of enolase protein 1 (concanavalin A-like superfamily)
MNLTLHIIRKDLRALRWGLILWVAACLTHLGLRLAQHVRGDDADFNAFWRSIEPSDRWDYAAMVILPILLIPLLLHLDPLRGRLAFWKTVPIGRGRLLRAKAIPVVALFVLLPFVCEVIYFVSAGLSAVLGAALTDWALRFLPGIAAIVVGCLLTRSLKTGVPAVAVCLVLAFFLARWPSGRDRASVKMFRQAATKPAGSISAPAGARIEIVSPSIELNRVMHSDGTKLKEERVRVSLEIHAGGLPENVVVGNIQLELNDLQLPDRVVPALEKESMPPVYFASSGLPLQEQRADMSNHFFSNAKDAAHWEVSSRYYRIALKDLPAAGLHVKGKVRVALSRREILAKLPLEKNAAWAPGVHHFSLPDISDPSGTTISFHSRLRTILADPRGDTGGLALTPGTTFHLWLEHNTLPYRARQLTIPFEAWRPGFRPASMATMMPGMNGNNSTASTDLTRSLNRSIFTHRFDPVEARREEETPLALMRFAEERAAMQNWHLTIVRYSDVGTVELPLDSVVRKPVYQQNEDNDQLSAPRPSLAAELEEVKVPAKPSRDEANKAIAKIIEIAERQNEKSIRDHEGPLLDKLSAVGAGNLEALLSATATFNLEPKEFGGNRPRNRLQYQFMTSGPDRGVFWRRVLKAACDLARPEDKGLILRYHSPRVDLLPVIVANGWEAEALPAMYQFAATERVPEGWREVFARHPGPQTHSALLSQIRLRVLKPEQVAKLIERGAVEGREAATAVWEMITTNTGNYTLLQPAFALAVRHGAEGIPRDLQRFLRMPRESWSMSSTTPYSSVQKACTQSFALHSDCPAEPSDAVTWLEKNVHDLSFNAASGRYELRGKAAAPRDLARWGRFIDPLGLGAAKTEGADLILTSGGHKPDSVDEFPRVMREVEGDFTMEVTVQPAFDLAQAWSRQGKDVFQGAGLLLQAGTRWIRWERGLYKNADGHELREETMRAGKSTVVRRQNDTWDPAKPVRLRMSRRGDSFTTAWSQNDKPWVEAPASRNLGWPAKVLIGVCSTNYVSRLFPARFTSLKFEATSQEPAQVYPPIEPHPVGPATASGTSLGEWGAVENPIGSGLFTVEGTALSVAVAPRYSDYNIQAYQTAPRVMREVEGAFTFEATIEPTVKLDWNSSEVLLTAGPDYYVRLGIAVGWGSKLAFHAERAEAGGQAGGISMDAKRDLTKPIRIRLQRRGQLLHIAQQQEGGEWIQFRPVQFGAWPSKVQVGVAALNTSKELFTAKFLDVKLTRDTLP